MAVMPTGAGKTLTVSDIVNDHNGAAVAIAHRAELIVQMSLAFARNGIPHRIIGSPSLARICTAIHIADMNRNFINPHSRIAVSSAQTLVRYTPEPWMLEVGLWCCDEAHHVLATNMWGKVTDLFPNARGLMPTATPCRADGSGLGRHSDGVADALVIGPSMRELIRDGYLADYRIFAPSSDIDLASVAITASGDYSPPNLSKAVHASHIVGDIVHHYQTIAPGKLGVTFCVDIDACVETAAAYRSAGIPAQVISAKTPAIQRAHLMRQFKNREIMQLVNCDLLGEGVDVPAIEVVSMARPTASYSLFVQQFGRGLRPSEGKTHGILIDHVGNTTRHGLPDAPRTWSLDRRERRSRGSTPDDVIPVRTCLKCLAVYERIYAACPCCGAVPVPASRSTPDAVEGVLAEMSPELLARLRGEIDKPLAIPYGADPAVVGACKKRHRERGEAQSELRDTMALWGGWRTVAGDSVETQQARWFHTFGCDVLTAMGLGARDANELNERVRAVLAREEIIMGENGTND